jgi:hypothetical protein
MYSDLFEEFENSWSGRRCATLLEHGIHKPRQMFDDVYAAVTNALPRMVDRVNYTASQLCGPEFWAGLHKNDKSAAGMCLAFMVRESMIQLTMHRTPSGGGKRKYHRTPKRSQNASAVAMVPRPASNMFNL